MIPNIGLIAIEQQASPKLSSGFFSLSGACCTIGRKVDACDGVYVE